MGILMSQPIKQPFQLQEFQYCACNVEHNISFSPRQVDDTNSTCYIRVTNIQLIYIVDFVDVILVAHLDIVVSVDTHFLFLRHQYRNQN